MQGVPRAAHAARCCGSCVHTLGLLAGATNGGWPPHAADALGAAVEGQTAAQIKAAHPDGLVRYATSASRPFGRYTDDTQMALALARSLVEVGHLDAAHVSAAYAQDYEQWRGYGGTAQAILSRLKAGDADWRTVSREYFPEGSFANGGAMRIAPVGLAYRHASPTVLRKAVEGALHCTHVHPEAIDGAVVIAAACAWLAKQPPAQLPLALPHDNHNPTPLRPDKSGHQDASATSSTPAERAQGGGQGSGQGTWGKTAASGPAEEQGAVPAGAPASAGLELGLVWCEGQRAWALQLVQELLGHVHTPVFKERLQALQHMLTQVELPVPPFPHGPDAASPAAAVTSTQLSAVWTPYFTSEAWAAEVAQAYQLSGDVFQIRAADAVPMVLYAFCRHALTPHPGTAVLACTHYGGDTDTLAAMVGALMGAWLGPQHLPREWEQELENDGPMGRDAIVALGRRLAALDVQQ